MRNLGALTRREAQSAFLTPLAYVVMTVFLFFSGLFFYLIAATGREASMSGPFGVLSFLFLTATPLLTMRLFSEEYRSGTIEPLMTAPVTDAEIVLSKFLGAVAFFAFMLLPTGVYVAVLARFGEPDAGPIVSGYVGLFLMGCQFIALGLFFSALTRSQIVAGAATLVALLTLWILGEVGEQMHGSLAPMVAYVGTFRHLNGFSAGRIAFRDVFYFLSMTWFWLFLTVRAVESRRWR